MHFCNVLGFYYIAVTNGHNFSGFNSAHLLPHSFCGSEVLAKHGIVGSLHTAKIKVLAGLCSVPELLRLFTEFRSMWL